MEFYNYKKMPTFSKNKINQGRRDLLLMCLDSVCVFASIDRCLTHSLEYNGTDNDGPLNIYFYYDYCMVLCQ